MNPLDETSTIDEIIENDGPVETAKAPAPFGSKCDDFRVCPVCGGCNAWKIVDKEGEIPCEYGTRCFSCNHVAIWLYGYFV